MTPSNDKQALSPRYWSLTTFSNKRNQGSGEMADSTTGAGNRRDEPRESGSPRSKGLKTKTELCQWRYRSTGPDGESPPSD